MFEKFCKWYVPALTEMEWIWFKIKTANESKLYCTKTKSRKKKFGKLSLIPDVHITYHKG